MPVMSQLTRSGHAHVCVFCGSASGDKPAYADFARRLGASLAARRAVLVYGGASIGLMGIAADAALVAGGQVIGVLPESLRQRELAHTKLTELHITPDLASRKMEMLAISDAFISLPGGIGTLDELFEIWTLIQLGARRRPMVLVNQDGYYTPLLEFLSGGVREGFLSRDSHSMLATASTPEEAVTLALQDITTA
jgi:uncharacterized protein (TIGR00730 family)